MNVSLRALALTPERIPPFAVPLLFRSPRATRSNHSTSSERERLLDDGVRGRHRYLRLPSSSSPSPGGVTAALRLHRRSVGTGDQEQEDEEEVDRQSDTDLSTRAAMSLAHVRKVTTPYGFRAVLAESPCARRRESLFHKKPDQASLRARRREDPVEPADQAPPTQTGPSVSQTVPGPGPSVSQTGPGPSLTQPVTGAGPSVTQTEPGPGPSVTRRRPLGLQIMKELRALTPRRKRKKEPSNNMEESETQKT